MSELASGAVRSAITSWSDVESRFEELLYRALNDVDSLRRWMQDRSALEAELQEDMGWRYIQHSCDTASEAKQAALNFFIQEIEPHLADYNDKLNRKALGSPFLNQLRQEPGYAVYLRGMEKEVAMFRSENIPLFTEITTLANHYGQITGAMSVEVDGEERTFQQAALELKSTDRERRREVYLKINERRFAGHEELNTLFQELLQLRHQVAINAGYANFRDYMFDALGRFDYTPQHCVDFHESVEQHIVPLINAFEEERKAKLGYDTLKPWDLDVDPDLLPPLKPYSGQDDLIAKTEAIFQTLDPEYGRVIRNMREKGHFDLDSRIGKAPGGYNYPLYQSALPFIFMNSAGSMRDMITMMHEGGHAIHSWLSRDLELTGFKNTPSEIAEVASMAMELISMDGWDAFFSNAEELKRARRYQLEKILSILPWIATVDAFQHWLYTHPSHSESERTDAWLSIYRRFSGNVIDRSDVAKYEPYSWHRQLHIFEVPFYYIEYGIAQLGAIGIWKNYKSNPRQTLEQYSAALAEGYMKPLPELYRMAGIAFDFSPGYIQELARFVKAELEALR
jgi:oligoendopeptidase F